MIKATRRSACDALDQVTVTTASKAAARRRVISCILMPPCAEEQWRYSRIRLDYHILPPAAIFFQQLEHDKFPCGRPASSRPWALAPWTRYCASRPAVRAIVA